MDQNSTTRPDAELAGRVAVIAGGGSPGMGRATALALAQAGARVAIIDINRAMAEESVDRLREMGAQAISLQADMTDAAGVKEAMSQCVRDLGGIDILFNNTGVPATTQKLIADFEPDEWDRSIQLNLKSTFLGMKYAIPHMLAAGRGGAVVNNASVSGLRANVGGAPYGVAKAGVIHLTKVAALEYGARGIRVNAVCPYSISKREALRPDAASTASFAPAEPLSAEELEVWRRAQLPMLRSGKGYEVASAVRFLVSDAASWVNGAALPVDGGSAAGFYGTFRKR